MDCLADKHILVTGGGAPGAYGILNALKTHGNIKLSACDAKDHVIGKQIADDFFKVPQGDSPDYIPLMLKECEKRRIDLIFPITTKELLALSTNSSAFNQIGTEVLVSSPNSLTIANSKCALYDHLKKSNIAVPKYYIANNLEEFDWALDQFPTGQAIAFKPCIANGSRGFRIIDDNVDLHDLWLNQKPNSSNISREAAMKAVDSKKFTSVLVCEYLDGPEYSIDCLVSKNQKNIIIPRLRSKINNGISVEGTIENNTEVISYCKDILSSLDLFGPIGIQIKYHNKQPLILEINPRIQGSSIACLGAGVNIPVLSAALAFDHTLNDDIEIKWGTRFIRHYQEFFIH